MKGTGKKEKKEAGSISQRGTGLKKAMSMTVRNH